MVRLWYRGINFAKHYFLGVSKNLEEIKSRGLYRSRLCKISQWHPCTLYREVFLALSEFLTEQWPLTINWRPGKALRSFISWLAVRMDCCGPEPLRGGNSPSCPSGMLHRGWGTEGGGPSSDQRDPRDIRCVTVAHSCPDALKGQLVSSCKKGERSWLHNYKQCHKLLFFARIVALISMVLVIRLIGAEGKQTLIPPRSSCFPFSELARLIRRMRGRML